MSILKVGVKKINHHFILYFLTRMSKIRFHLLRNFTPLSLSANQNTPLVPQPKNMPIFVERFVRRHWILAQVTIYLIALDKANTSRQASVVQV